jgi:hypothetical protein
MTLFAKGAKKKMNQPHISYLYPISYILCDCEAIAYLRFRHLGQFFTESSDYYDAPINKVLHFIRSVGSIKGLKGDAQ